jgi:cytoskeletal protein RodZ
MRRLAGVVLFLALFSACEPVDGDATVAVVTTTTAEATASTSTSSPTSTSTSSTTTTTVARPTTTAAPQRVPAATTVPVTQRVPTTTTVPVPKGGACDPNYAGACVPIDSDVDCAGGSGNGPSYTSAKNIQVIGSDIYGLDGNDNDGIGCES